MTRITRRAGIGAGLAFVLAEAAEAQPMAAPQAATIIVSAPWSRAAGQGGTGVGYLTLRNTGTAPDRLLAARASIARTVELHTHIHDNGVMRMRPVPAIELPPGQEVLLRPSGLHIMLIGLTAPLRQGDRVPLTLVFERAGEVQVQLAVESAGARGPGPASHAH
jgi:copper(I)-binding protein